MSNDRLTAVLAEYQALRNEVNLKLHGFYHIYTIYFTALTLFYGYVVANKIVDFVLAVPVVALALFMRLFYDQLMIQRIGNYLLSACETQVPKIIAAASPNTSPDLPEVMQWEQFNRRDPLPRYYKGSIFVVFIVMSVLPPIAYNLYSIAAHCTAPYCSALPMCLQWISLIVNLTIGGWITYRVIKDAY